MSKSSKYRKFLIATPASKGSEYRTPPSGGICVQTCKYREPQMPLRPKVLSTGSPPPLQGPATESSKYRKPLLEAPAFKSSKYRKPLLETPVSKSSKYRTPLSRLLHPKVLSTGRLLWRPLRRKVLSTGSPFSPLRLKGLSTGSPAARAPRTSKYRKPLLRRLRPRSRGSHCNLARLHVLRRDALATWKTFL